MSSVWFFAAPAVNTGVRFGELGYFNMITGKDVAEAVFSDLESCFYPSAKFRVNYEYSDAARQHASFIGSGKNSKIRMSGEFRDFTVNNISDVFFIAIIVCHECAHYLNKHNDYKDTESMDFTAIEAWADYFGGRIFGVIITFGKKTQSIIKKFQSKLTQEALFDLIGLAIKDIYEKIYNGNTDKRYCSPEDRFFVFNAGFMSFFYQIHNELKPDFILRLFPRILRNFFLLKKTSAIEINQAEHDEITKKISEIHKNIQQNRVSIMLGVKDKYLSLLSTNYILSDTYREKKKTKLTEQAERLGVK